MPLAHSPEKNRTCALSASGAWQDWITDVRTNGPKRRGLHVPSLQLPSIIGRSNLPTRMPG